VRIRIPTPTELHPRLSELENKRNNLHADKTAKIAEAAIIRARIQESPNNGNAAQNRVREILGEVPLPETAPDMARLEQLLRELQDINTALAILDGAIQKEKAIASRLVCDAMKPEVTKRAKAFAKALIDLHAANSEYDLILDEIENTGTSIGSLGRVWINGLGSVKDPCGGFHYGMREFVDAGFLDRSQIPQAIR
jgi:hypothetical protein